MAINRENKIPNEEHTNAIYDMFFRVDGLNMIVWLGQAKIQKAPIKSGPSCYPKISGEDT